MNRGTILIDTLDRIRSHYHPGCFVARGEEAFGLGVHYVVRPDGQVEATSACPPSWEGYPGLVHGGIIASLLDGAMTNCLFSHGFVAVTAELRVRYRHPVVVGQPATIRGEITRCSYSPFLAQARILQHGEVRASCTGKFMPVPDHDQRSPEGGPIAAEATSSRARDSHRSRT